MVFRVHHCLLPCCTSSTGSCSERLSMMSRISTWPDGARCTLPSPTRILTTSLAPPPGRLRRLQSANLMPRPRLLVLYHFFHPDQVVSARIFSDLAEEQAKRGWDVTALTCNRSHAEASARYPSHERWNGVQIHRAFRPAWSQ